MYPQIRLWISWFFGSKTIKMDPNFKILALFPHNFQRPTFLMLWKISKKSKNPKFFLKNPKFCPCRILIFVDFSLLLHVGNQRCKNFKLDAEFPIYVQAQQPEDRLESVRLFPFYSIQNLHVWFFTRSSSHCFWCAISHCSDDALHNM